MFRFADNLLLLPSHWDKETEFCGYILSYKDTNSIMGTQYPTVITLWRYYFQILPHCMYNVDLGARGYNSLICSVRNAMIIFTGPFLLHHTRSAKGHCGFSVLTPGLFKSFIFSLKLSPPPPPRFTNLDQHVWNTDQNPSTSLKLFMSGVYHSHVISDS